MNAGVVVKPMPQASIRYKQSNFDMPKLHMRTMICGRSAAGKGTLIASMLQEQYKDCFEAIHVFASTIAVDPLWISMVDHIQKTLGQVKDTRDMQDIPIGFNTIDETAIRKILARGEQSLKRQKAEGVKLVKGTLLVFDDMSHSASLQKHQSGIFAELFTVSRHYSCSLLCSVHSVSSLGSLPRRQLSTLILFPDSNRRSYESLSEQYSRLAGKDKSVFDEVYNLALGKDSPPYSFLVINLNEIPERRFMLRFSDFIVLPEED